MTITHEYAGFRLRLTAFALDYTIIFGYILVLLAVNVGVIVTKGLPLQPVSNPLLSDLTTFVILILPVILYFAWQESSAKQATWGKRKVGLRVVTATGESLSLKRAVVRSLVKFLPWQLAHTSIYHIFGVESPPSWATVGLALVWVLVSAYLISLLLTKTHRAPYDWLAGSFVIVSPQENV